LNNFEYFDPTSVGEAVALLRQHAGSAKVLAGGTDLFLRMHRRVVMPDVVIDLKRIAELANLSYSGQDGLRIGATVTHGEVAEHAAVRQHYGALVTAANWVGSLQTRHRGTVVGNLCNASPAADTAPALLSYGAIVSIVGPDGQRELVGSVFSGTRADGVGISGDCHGLALTAAARPPRLGVCATHAYSDRYCPGVILCRDPGEQWCL
jgi:carbon-monoxide dehydrogenase medium subunit